MLFGQGGRTAEVETFYGLEFGGAFCQPIQPLLKITFSDVDAGTVLVDSEMSWTDRELTAWLDELLPAVRMAEFESQLRTDPALQARVAQVIRNRDQGGNSIGEIWQRARLSCPVRTELGGYLLGTLSPEATEYIDFHLKTVGCRVCQANLHDLEEQSSQSDDLPVRRRRFFESSAGLLRTDDESGRF